jgi:hypothetical protein
MDKWAELLKDPKIKEEWDKIQKDLKEAEKQKKGQEDAITSMYKMSE